MVSTVSAARAGTAAAKIAAPDRTQAVVLVIVFIFIFIFIFLLLSCSRQPLAGNPPSSSNHRYHQTMGPRASAARMLPALDARRTLASSASILARQSMTAVLSDPSASPKTRSAVAASAPV